MTINVKFGNIVVVFGKVIRHGEELLLARIGVMPLAHTHSPCGVDAVVAQGEISKTLED